MSDRDEEPLEVERLEVRGDSITDELRVLETGERDQKLQRLHEERAIDTGSYVAASRQERVRFKHPRFEHLPDREGLYDLLGALDEGGMGEVRIAKDPYLDRKVALKLLRAEKVHDPLNVERFIREAQITAKLDHPNIIPIYSMHAEGDGRASFAMKLVAGVTLADIINEVRESLDGGPSSAWVLRRRLELILKICDAMAYAHDMGVIHRDIKPANVMVGRYNEVYVMDWGLAKTTEEAEDEATQTAIWAAQREDAADPEDSIQTQHGAMIGTPLYMAPEQAMGEHSKVGPRSDQYAIGAILFELVTLQRLIGKTKKREVLLDVMKGVHQPVEAYGEHFDIDPELAAIIERASHHEAQSRYDSVAELADDLRRYLDDEEVIAHPDSSVRAAQRWIAHHRARALAMLLVLSTLAGAGVVYNLWEQKRVADLQQQRERQRTADRYRRDRELAHLQATVTEKAHAVDRQFLRFQLLVNRLSLATQQLLAVGVSGDERMFLASDYDAGQGPPDVQMSKLYRKPISVNYPVFKPAPGVDFEAVEPMLRRLQPLKSQFQSVFVESRLDANTEHESLWETIAVRGVPGRWAFVGLAAGVHISYPGKGGYGVDYDPRKRPWYLAGKGQTRPTWGPPYVDQQGQGIVLPCVVAIGDVGVAGFEVTLDFVQERFLKPEGAVTEAFVVDDSGKVLVASKTSRYATEVADVAELPVLDNEIVLTMIKEKRSGLEVDSLGEPAMVYVVAQMPTLNWYYVAQAPLEAVLTSSASHRSSP